MECLRNLLLVLVLVLLEHFFALTVVASGKSVNSDRAVSMYHTVRTVSGFKHGQKIRYLTSGFNLRALTPDPRATTPEHTRNRGEREAETPERAGGRGAETLASMDIGTPGYVR
ncbi:hypothetical protein BZA05DRAFT_433834 [Tricharina praecox]|uniref:uncharacterized protein n=1 Tax=Tricharina praecox TaxID=43433 RepID=UPI002220523C|nr:uncharacterized protein BZA05DRAFT_433834 [Tricharina praecox]KAI5857221.1 hypothetical protein BZA05DRAFT_433834 [Tricharina praecox]